MVFAYASDGHTTAATSAEHEGGGCASLVRTSGAHPELALEEDGVAAVGKWSGGSLTAREGGGGDGGFEGLKRENRLAKDEVAMAENLGVSILDKRLLIKFFPEIF